MTTNRRDLLKAGMTGLAYCGLQSKLGAMTSGKTKGTPRLLMLYLRGGADGLNMLVPHQDQGYAQLRPVLYGAQGTLIPHPSMALNFHPALSRLAALDQTKIAYIHRSGNMTGERSHFTEQHLTETGLAAYSATDSGWLPQVAAQATLGAPVPTVSISKKLQRTFLSTLPASQGVQPLHLQEPFGAPTGMPLKRFLEIPYGTGDTQNIKAAVANAVSVPPSYTVSGNSAYLRDTIDSAHSKLDSLRGGLSSFDHDTALAGGKFLPRLEEALNLLISQGTAPPLANVAGVELGGWDSHAAQTGADYLALLNTLDVALSTAYQKLDAETDDFLIYVVSEFGRTVKDNGSGTDHGVGGLTMVMGRNVNGGIYNAWDPTWTQLAAWPRLGKQWKPLKHDFDSVGNVFADAQDPVTDFRTILVEIAVKFFGINVSNLPPALVSEWGPLQTSMLGFL